VDVIRPPITTIAIGARKLGSHAQPERDRQHAGAHRDGGHHDGPCALVAGVDQRLEARQAVLAPRHDGVLHQQDRVLGRRCPSA